MIRFLVAYFSAALVFVALDALWLTVLMGETYKSTLGPLMLEQPRMAPAVAFYVLYLVGIVVFGILPGIRADDWKVTAALCALFGLLAYATYDLSNLATLKGWSLRLSLIDMAWGALVSCVAGVAGYAAASRWAK